MFKIRATQFPLFYVSYPSTVVLSRLFLSGQCIYTVSITNEHACTSDMMRISLQQHVARTRFELASLIIQSTQVRFPIISPPVVYFRIPRFESLK